MRQDSMARAPQGTEVTQAASAQSSRGVAPRVVPFAIYLGFIGVASLLSWLSEQAPAVGSMPSLLQLWLYPVKTAAVLASLIWFWSQYDELKDKPFADRNDTALAVAVGVLVYGAWVRMDWPWATQGQAAGYDPFQAGATGGLALAAIRLFGAVMVVPVMEELFWRSFLIRYVMSSDFRTVRVGAFSVGSFVVTVALFGLEHHLWLAGMMAGAAYNVVLYRTGRIWPCILAHAVTNFILGLHVLMTGEWIWW